jgi:predicted RNA-binding Zn-ribbon protein involved in translation (DUF1610 family)
LKQYSSEGEKNMKLDVVTECESCGKEIPENEGFWAPFGGYGSPESDMFLCPECYEKYEEEEAEEDFEDWEDSDDGYDDDD